MCVIISKPSSVLMPSLTELKAAWNHNPDGAGLLYKRENDNQFTIVKGFMNWKSFKKYIKKANFKTCDHVSFHFRIATSGNVNSENCHPFPISSKNSDLKKTSLKTNKALIHNGVLFSPNGQYSDTQIFTKYLSLKNLVDLSNDKKLEKINNMISGNRVMIAENDNIVYLGNWHEIDGMFYSNTNHLESFCNSFIDSDYMFENDLTDEIEDSYDYMMKEDIYDFYDERYLSEYFEAKKGA